MQYVRFLKPPVLTSTTGKVSSWTVRTLITITSDLGDDFFAADASVLISLLYDGDQNRLPIYEQSSVWRAGSRALQLICNGVKIVDPKRPMRLVIGAKCSDLADEAACTISKQIPSIVTAWSGPFSSRNPIAEKEVERRLVLSGANTIRIREETGNSIACHIW